VAVPLDPEGIVCLGPHGQVCAFDLSLGMIRRVLNKPRTPGDMVFQGDVLSIPFTEGGFDRVICFAPLPHFNNPGKALQEMDRALNTNGILIVAHLLSREELAAHHGAHQTVARDILPAGHEMKSLFEQAGFLHPDIVDIPGRYMATVLRKPRQTPRRERRNMSKDTFPSTQAIRVLKQSGILYTLYPYDYQEKGGTRRAAHHTFQL